MLHLLLGTDWIRNRNTILEYVAEDVRLCKKNTILIVPELITHDMERRLCESAGDTASRYAEVLSFSRMALRAADYVGLALEDCLDNGGRVVAMAAAARILSSRLKAYASVETKPEFLTGLVDAVDEFKRCCITAKNLKEASLLAEGSLAQKLEELSLLLETYDSLCAQGKRDPRDRMSWLLEQIEESDFGRDHTFYIDGFPDFTRQHMAVLSHLIETSAHVTVSLNCDHSNSEALAFEKAGHTAAELIRIAEKLGVTYEIKPIVAENDDLAYIRAHIFQGRLDSKKNIGSCLQLIRTDSPWQECVAAAEHILSMVHSGCRFRDIGVVCTDLSHYRPLVSMVFHRCRIPVYLSGTDDILEKSVVTTILSAMDAASGDLEQREVLRYFRCILSQLDPDLCDLIENYVIMWGIKGNGWNKEWKFHPDGLGEQWTDDAVERLNRLNEAKDLAVGPLMHLRNGFRKAVNLSDQIQTLYNFFEDISLQNRLGELADQLDQQGNNRSAQELNQLWEIMIGAMEQMYDVLGSTVWNTESFVRLFKLLLSQYDVGTIPTVLDSVTVGPVTAMRCQETKHLIVLGAIEGSLPSYGGSIGVLTDQERVALRQLGVPLTGGAMEGLQEQFAEIYGVFCGCRETITVTCPAGQPSMVYRRLLEMAESETVPQILHGAALCDPMDASALLVHQNDRENAKKLSLQDSYEDIQSRVHYDLGHIEREHIFSLYGDRLRLSASQVDRLAECRLSYYLKYGLRIKEQKEITVDSAEFGTFVHAVLENTAREIKKLGGFHSISKEETLTVAKRYADQYATERFGQLDSRRLSYLFRRNSAELKMVVEELWQELQDSKFEPVGFEVEFGSFSDMPPIAIAGADMKAELRGFVDRVDQWNGEIGNFFRVVDYKTGKKEFDYCDVFNGVGLQMLLYLFALESGGEKILGSGPIPAGVQYFPARAPVLSADGRLSAEETDKLRLKQWRREGLLLDNETVLQAMEPGDQPIRLNYTVRKDGSRSGDLANRDQLGLLKRYVFHLLTNLVNDIASGNVAPNPYTRGASHSACDYCPYGTVCHQDEVKDRRNYKTMSSQQFWEGVEKEVLDRG